MKTFKSLITVSALLMGTTTVFAASHAGAPVAKDVAKKEAVTPAPASAPAPAPAASADMADGEVRKIDKENKKITLRHGPIKSLDMPPMSMVFGVKDVALLDGVKVGDKVKFKSEQTGTVITVTDIQPVK